MEIVQEIPVLNMFAEWISEHLIAILVILLGAALLKRFGMVPLEGFVRRAVKTSRFQTEAQHRQREETLLYVATSVFSIIVVVVTGILLLLQLNINLQPFLAAGGVAGIVFGLGAQNIMKDIFAGVYVITENQYQVSDIVDLDGDVGVVEEITLRACVLRDLDGTVHHVPHGTVNRVKNLSKDYARINMDVSVSYDTDIKTAAELINRVGKELFRDSEWENSTLTPPAFLRLESFSDSSMELKITGDTKPGQQWAVAGELRKRLKVAFDEAGIEIPFPQLVVHDPRKQDARSTK